MMMAGPPCSLVSSIPCTPSLIDNTASAPAAMASKELKNGARTMAMMTSAALALVWAATLVSLAASLPGLILLSVAFQEDTISVMRRPRSLPKRSLSESSRVPSRFLVGGNARRQFVSPVVSKTSHIPVYQTLGY
ncbi:predicted protein [Chaetomium globosum CBS 148.51]|uniref:Uncharacterized protein n=1 Tax=Chaetomium globosum (strain ATCC 6205 / CBS 148.51 / DSM 1962 / NBRC 6347 / NRRL 1970) TaxID=306901 RepID=Q2GRC3_CHAGB|nr:uncharacterized protein CHGG_09481 [Chaetomium globosum CBS 148.51]EAQ85467.1 predicted protein [Chaetomium globosum CBS 148.51]